MLLERTCRLMSCWINELLLYIYSKFGGGTVSILRATKCFHEYGANVHIVEFGSIHKFIVVSMLEKNTRGSVV
jgi:hypothetical protein